MKGSSPKPGLWRFWQSYRLTLGILSSYLLQYFLSLVFGQTRLAAQRQRLHRKNARRLKNHILKLKGLFIKVGQMLSIMTQFLPTAYIEELEGLQDSVPPAPYPEIEQRFLEEFGERPEEIFKKFEPTPIASASLGQVHIAYLKNGEKVAVKVQYPDIEAIVRIDLKILRRIFSLLNLFFPQYGLKKVYTEIREMVLAELDFNNEAKNIAHFTQNFATDPQLIFPRVYAEFSTARILTLEFMQGVKISAHEGLQQLGVTPRQVATTLIHAYCKQIFIDGIYHADPHPGNFLIQAQEEEVEVLLPTENPEDEAEIGYETQQVPRIVFMDFGAVARISEEMRRGIAQFIEGIIRRDHQVISQAMKNMGFIAKTQDEEVFDKIVDFFYSKIKDIKFEEIRQLKIQQFQHLEDIFELHKFDISLKDLLVSFNVPKDWALLERTLILLIGLTTHLDPKLNPLTIIIPYAEAFVLGKDRNFSDLILDALKELGLGYLKLPTEIQKTLKKLEQGQIAIANPQGLRQTRILSRALNRLTYSLLAMGSLGAAWTLKQAGMPHVDWAYYSSGFFGIVLAYQLLRRS